MFKKEWKYLDITKDQFHNMNILNISKGKYKLRVIHQYQDIFEKIKSLFVSFNIVKLNESETKKVLGLQYISERYGVFSYIGGGESLGNYYVQEILLNIKEDLTDLKITLRTFLPNIDITVEAIQLYNVLIPETELLESTGIFFIENTLPILPIDKVGNAGKTSLLVENISALTERSGNKLLLIDNNRKKIPTNNASNVKLSFNILTLDNAPVENSSLVVVTLIGKNRKVLPSDNFGINPNLGTYQYLKVGSLDKPEINELEFVIDEKEGIDHVELTFKPWGKEKTKNYIDMDTFKVDYINNQQGLSNRDLFLNKLSTDDKLILLYTTAPYVGHETLELRPNRLTKEYIKKGYKVIFFAFSRVPDELELPEGYDNNLLQCHKDDLTEITSILIDKKLKEKIFICSSFPDIFAYTVITRLKQFLDWSLVYEIRDDMEEFNRVGYSHWYTTQLEVKVARLVDKIMTVSPRLAQKIKVMSSLSQQESQKVTVIQNAAPDTLIEKSKYLRSPDLFNRKTKSCIVGYIGHLTPAWFDWTLLLTAAQDFPHIKFEIIGHGMPENLELPANIEYLGPKNHDEFLKISESWKVGLIPFITSPLTYGVDPNKIYEYLAANLLVVTADMGSVRECPATYVYENYEEFSLGLEQALNVTYDSDLLSKIITYVNKSRWSNRAQSMIDFIHKEIR